MHAMDKCKRGDLSLLSLNLSSSPILHHRLLLYPFPMRNNVPLQSVPFVVPAYRLLQLMMPPVEPLRVCRRHTPPFEFALRLLPFHPSPKPSHLAQVLNSLTRRRVLIHSRASTLLSMGILSASKSRTTSAVL